jgi:hypothetical protein
VENAAPGMRAPPFMVTGLVGAVGNLLQGQDYH